MKKERNKKRRLEVFSDMARNVQKRILWMEELGKERLRACCWVVGQLPLLPSPG